MITSVALLIIGFMMENKKFSPIRMALFYFLAGGLGNLFAVSIEFECSVGPMAAVMGMVSGLLGSIIVNWKALAGAGYMRIILIFMMVFLFIILLILSAGDTPVGIQWQNLSMASEGGGFMAGIGLGMMLCPFALQRDSPYVGMIRKIGALLTFVYACILIPVFFFSVEPTKTIWAYD